MKKESAFQAEVIYALKETFPGCVVMKTDANYIQGFPDLLLLYNNQWAALECKRASNSSHRPTQDYYVKKLNSMSYARFIHPDNKKEVLDELQQTFGSCGATCISGCK